MKKRYLLLSLLSCLGVASLGIATTLSNNVGQNVFGSDCSHDGNHYVAGPNYVEFWTCCRCHETFLIKPAQGKFVDNDASSMQGGIPSIAIIEKDIEKLTPDIENLSNYEKVKNANILYTLNSKISSLTDAEKDKLHIDTFNSVKANYETYITPLYGFNDTDTISPFNTSGETPYDSQISSITKINKELYGQMYDVEFKPDAGMKNHFMSLDNLKESLSSFDSLAFIAINDVTPSGTVGSGANIIHLRNNWKLLKAGELPGYNVAPVGTSYVNGENLVEVSSSKIISTSGKNEFSDFQIDFQNTWNAATSDHNHLYLTGLFGLKNIDLQGMADKVIASITKAITLKLTSNEIAAQATLLADAARKQYEALPSAAKTLVTNYADLETLENTLTSYTYMLKTTSMSIKQGEQGEEVYNDIDVTYQYDSDYGNITHLKCKKEVEKSISISFGFSDGAKAFACYSKIIIFLRTPNLTSGISGVIDCGDPYLWLGTGTIKTDWAANTNQDLKSTTSQKLNGIRLTNNIIPSWATGYGELEFTSFVLIKDGVTYIESH